MSWVCETKGVRVVVGSDNVSDPVSTRDTVDRIVEVRIRVDVLDRGSEVLRGAVMVGETGTLGVTVGIVWEEDFSAVTPLGVAVMVSVGSHPRCVANWMVGVAQLYTALRLEQGRSLTVLLHTYTDGDNTMSASVATTLLAVLPPPTKLRIRDINPVAEESMEDLIKRVAHGDDRDDCTELLVMESVPET